MLSRRNAPLVFALLCAAALLWPVHAQITQPIGFINGGQTWGANTTLGNLDAFELGFKTNNIKALAIDSTQFIDSATQPRSTAFNSAAQTIGTGAFAVLTFDSEDYDVGSLHSTSSNTGRMTIPTGGDGFYLVIGQSSFGASAAGNTRALRISKNGTTNLAQQSVTQAGATLAPTLHISVLTNLVATDWVQLDIFQDSGGNLSAGSAANREVASALQIVKLW